MTARRAAADPALPAREACERGPGTRSAGWRESDSESLGRQVERPRAGGRRARCEALDEAAARRNVAGHGAGRGDVPRRVAAGQRLRRQPSGRLQRRGARRLGILPAAGGRAGADTGRPCRGRRRRSGQRRRCDQERQQPAEPPAPRLRGRAASSRAAARSALAEKDHELENITAARLALQGPRTARWPSARDGGTLSAAGTAASAGRR